MKANKYTRFMLTDRDFLLHVSVVLVLLFVMLFVRSIVGRQQKKLLVVRQESALVGSIAEMEASLKGQAAIKKQAEKAAEPLTLPTAAKKDLIFQGTGALGGVIYVLINDEIFKAGDAAYEYVITDVQIGVVTLQNTTTQETHILRFPEELDLNSVVINKK